LRGIRRKTFTKLSPIGLYFNLIKNIPMDSGRLQCYIAIKFYWVLSVVYFSGDFGRSYSNPYLATKTMGYSHVL
jgi:hypothetical protein